MASALPWLVIAMNSDQTCTSYPFLGRGVHRLAGIENMTNGLAWTPDGRWITYTTLNGTIWRVRPHGSHRERVADIPDRKARRLMWSGDGRHLAYTARSLEDER